MRHILCILLTVSLLAACNGNSGRVSSVPRCPDTGLLREADSMIFLNPVSTEDKPVIDVKGFFGSYRGACQPSRRGGMDFVLEFDFLAERSLEGADIESIDLPYFVAVVAPGEEIVSRESKKVTIDFSKLNQGKETEKHRLYIPVRDIRDAWKYRVVAGFELSPAQYEYNMKVIAGQDALRPKAKVKIPKGDME